MCGIFGVVARSGPVDVNQLERLTDLVAHRGPDGRGTVVIGGVGLGHRRLSIIDTSDAGAQPMRHASQPLTLVFNGEIYNYLELRAELQRAGHVFHTGSDTEVILAAYLAWGAACVERFNGMWAFALLDGRSGTLFCSRDRFGVKPFHFTETPTAFAFGSELRQLVPLLARSTANLMALQDHLASGLTDHLPESFIRGVQLLPPGANLVYELATHRWRIDRHYTPRPDALPPRSPGEVAERARALLTDAVRLRLRSDVRVGTCLSGGLDSSGVAALAAAQRPAGAEACRAITAISETPENSEEAFARAVVQRSGLAWVPVRPTGDDFEAALQEVIDTQEAPFGGPSIAMQHFVMRAAQREGVKVLLDGQGADECWFGYQRHAAVWLRDSARSGPLSLWHSLRAALAHNADLPPKRLAAMTLAGFAPALAAGALAERYPAVRQAPALPRAWVEYLQLVGQPAAVQASDLTLTSLPMLLRYADRSSMRFGVEARLPYLDYRLVELAMATPVAFKLHDGWTKWPLRQGLADALPAEITWRRSKLGFEAPDQLWLQRIRPLMKKTVGQSKLLAELFNLPRLVAAFDGLGRTAAWRLFSVAAWERQQGITDLA